ncbi:hypothetical protein [Candidatus Thiodictyon syntrophicum]|nr:hypothetical protein [Candidatus Thiodictyon syntrophicum]
MAAGRNDDQGRLGDPPEEKAMTNPPYPLAHFLLIALLPALFGMPVQAQDETAAPVATAPAVDGAAAAGPRARLPEQDRWFGMISDLHFDPFYDPSLVARLAAAEPSRWEEIFAASSITTPSASGSDTNFPPHMDEFRVLADEAGKPFTFERVVPSISPIYGNNPGYQVYRYDRSTGAPVDYVTMTYKEAADTGGNSQWTKEYGFEEAYGVGPLTPSSLTLLSAGIISDPNLRTKFIAYYGGEASPGPIPAGSWQSPACALTNLDAQAFSTCCVGVSR